MTSKQRCLAALAGQPVDRTPVFPLLMFLAADRAGLSYRQYATDGLALAEAQLAARRRYGLDAVTACSDAFRISADLGGDMDYPLNGTPHLVTPLVRGADDLSKIGRPDPLRSGSRMADRCRAVSAMARAIGDECLVLGWVEMPFAEACDWCGLSDFMLLLIDDPPLAHRILQRAAEINIDFALAQIRAGAHMIGCGDAAASLISPDMYRQFALPYEQQVCRAIHAAGGLVKLHVCGNTTALLPDMATCEADLFNVDHMVDLERAVAVYGSAGKCFKGNLNPVADMLQTTADECARRTERCIQVGRGGRYMLSAGCEIPAAVSDENMQAFCSAASAG